MNLGQDLSAIEVGDDDQTVEKGRTLNPRIRCAIYTRQSTRRESGEDLSSCDVQRDNCALFIQSQKFEGWELLPERFDDIGHSGVSLKRPALQRLFRACVDGRIDRVVVWKLDRLTRKLDDWIRVADRFKYWGIELTLAGQVLECAGLSVTHFVEHVLVSFAEFERELIRERLRDARASRSVLGLRTSGRAPFGYDVLPSTRQLVPNETESKIVRQMFELGARGENAASIARWLNESGHRTRGTARKNGGQWTGRTVLQILRNPAYIGMRRLGDKKIPAMHPPLIDIETAEQVERAIAARRTVRSRRRQRHSMDRDDPYMLRGILYCDGCGRPMTTSASKPVSLKQPNAHPRYYRCRGTSTKAACKPPVQVPAAEVESAVIFMLRDKEFITRQSRAVAALLGALRPHWKKMSRASQTESLRRLLWRATWKPKQTRVKLLFDEVAVEQFLEDSPDRDSLIL